CGRTSKSVRKPGAEPGHRTRARRRANSVRDLDGSRHTGSKDHSRGNLIDMDADRNALSEAYPGKDRIDAREPLLIGLSVGDVNAASDAVDMPSSDLAVAHELDAGRVPDANRLELGLFEVAIDPERIRIHNGDLVLADTNVVAELREQIGDVAIDRGADLSALEVDPRLL